MNNRVKRTGKYTYTGGLERLCTCEHSLGTHFEERVKLPNGEMRQECGKNHFESDSDGGKPCQCKLFKPKK